MAETTSKTTTTKKPAAKAAPAKPAAKAAAPVAKAPEKKAAVAKKPAAEKKPAAAKKPVAGKKLTVTPEVHYCMVAEAAYFRAERNGFMSDPVRDWIEAEMEIAAMLSGKK